tara:strand:+ start:168 stop:1100 length:933 start_codon:yes stop_codon:yes gene_type:complete
VLVNNTQVVDRANRPNVSQRIGLRTFFINDGAYVDPYEISSVQLFKRSATLSPNSVLGDENLVSSVPKMEFGASGETITSHANFNPTNYVPGVMASGIYRLGQGDYVVVLDQTLALSGWNYTNSIQVAASSLSAVDDYVDLWTVKLNSASKYQVITNRFSLHEDTFFAFTEPLLITTSHRLMNKHVRLGEVVDLKLATETTLQNQNIDHSVQNIFKDSIITNATMEVRKVEQDINLDGPFTVVSFADSVGNVDITGDNTMILSWDTTTIKNLSSFTNGTFGSLTGTYSVQVKYTLLNQTIISPLFYLTVS